MRHKIAWGIMCASMLGFGWLSSACAPSFDTLCEEYNDCIDGNEEDFEACQNRMDLQYDDATHVGCGETFDELLACWEEEGTCENEVFVAGSDNDDCDDEREAHNSCLGSGASTSPFFPPAF